MSLDAELLPVAQIEDLVRALVKGLRAFQMYLPNNPMYQRADQALREAFPPVFAVLDDVTFVVREDELLWEDQVVYRHDQRSESFAWTLYKDGMRLVSFRRGCEDDEIGRFLQTVSQARRLAADASDDLLTLLWGREFERIGYQFAEVVSDPWVYDPQALTLGSGPEATPADVREQVRSEAAEPRPPGIVDPEDFDSTLYFLDETEIAEFHRQVEQEYARDVRGTSLETLADIFELEADPAVREEALAAVEGLLPVLLAQGAYRTVALILREFRAVVARAPNLDDAMRARVNELAARLSEPGTIGQLLQALDDAATPPAEADLAEVLQELKAPALGTILTQLPRLISEPVRELIGTAAHRLAAANVDELTRLLRELDPVALPGAIRLAGRLGLQGAVPALALLVGHAETDVRLAAVEVLGVLGTPGALGALEPALEDPERAVRAAALAMVTKRSYAGALRRLEKTVQGRSPRELERAERRAMFEAYATIAGPAGLETLRGLLLPQGLFRRRLDADTRTCAVYAVGRVRSPEARALLEQLTSDKDLPVRHAALSLLREWAG